MLVISYMGIVWPTYVLLAVSCGALPILMIILSNVFAQSDDLSSVLKNAQKSLGALGNKTPTSPPITPHQSMIPKNVDMNVETTLTYDPSDENWYFPENAKFNFAKGNTICPQKDCVQLFDKISLFWSGEYEG